MFATHEDPCKEWTLAIIEQSKESEFLEKLKVAYEVVNKRL